MRRLILKAVGHWGFAAIFILTLILRFPSFFEPYWYGDEGISLTVGQRWFLGEVPYLSVVDNKPPLIYLIFGASKDLFFLKLITAVWVLATLTVVYFLARRIASDLKLKNNLLPILASVIFAITSSTPIFEGNIANGEIFLIFPVAIGATIIYQHSRKRVVGWKLFLAGLAFSTGALLKIPAVFDFLAMLVLLLVVSQLKQTGQLLKDWLILILGFTLPWLIFGFYFWTNDGLLFFVKSVFGNNVGYVGVENHLLIPQGRVVLKGLLATNLIVVIAYFSKKIGFVKSFLYLWLIMAIFGSLLSGRDYTHYLIQALVPFSIIIALHLVQFSKKTALEFLVVATFMLATFFWGGFHTWRTLSYYQNFLSYTTDGTSLYDYQEWFDPRVPRLAVLANYLNNNKKPSDQLLIWGNEPDLYFLTEMKPATRFIAAYHITSMPEAKIEALKKLNEQKPRFAVTVDDVPERYDELITFVKKNYQPVFNYQEAHVWELMNAR